MTARLVYMGTPEFACPALEMLASRTDVEIGLVVTQPDRQSGRGRKMQATRVAHVAERIGLPVYRAGSLRTREARQPIVDIEPDLIVVAAFGLILGSSILRLPPRGCVNLHASLLPAYRGANPIAIAIRDGVETTGVTLMRMEHGLDTGPIYASVGVDITQIDTTASLTPRLAESASHLLDRHLSDLLAGISTPTAQSIGATCTRPMTKDDGWIDWRSSAVDIERHVRAMWAWPRAWTTLPSGERLQVHQSHVIDFGNGEPGLMTGSDGKLLVGCERQSLVLDIVQIPGGKPVPGASVLARGIITPGEILGKVGRTCQDTPLVTPC